MGFRFDSIGLFWEDIEQQRGKRNVVRVMPPIPDTGWTPPTDFPNLSTARAISIDTETYDPGLTEKVGPGWARGVGHIVGVSVAAVANGHYGKWYFPMRHEVEPEYNMDPDKVLDWLRQTLSDPNQYKIGANLQYDVGWLRQEGVEVAGPLFDVQYAEALLDEASPVALDALGAKYLGEGKETSQLYQWCGDFYGGKANQVQRKNIYRAPPRLVGPYAEADADLPLRLADILYPKLVAEGLSDLMAMECRLIRLLIDMRFAGVSVDVDKADRLREELVKKEEEAQSRLNHIVGAKVNINSPDHLKKAFDHLGLSYKLTAKGNPSFTKSFLEGVRHPIGDCIREIRDMEKLRGTFLESYILDSHIDGKVYGQFHSLRGEEKGTRSGRFSSSNPNLQNIPSRDEEMAPLVRGIFVPDKGHKQWRKYDYSQIEYRFLVHFAIGPMADAVRQSFINNPNIDYHELVRQMIYNATGIMLDRKPTKNINFGLIYGMGVAKLAADLGLTKKQGKELFEAYHKGAPFAKATMEACIKEAQQTGVVTTILGRKSRFNLWEPNAFNSSAPAVAYEKAILMYGGKIKRAHTHKALNRRLQGSAADLMKVAMDKCYQDGIFDATGVPRLTVHDELDFSDPGGRDEAFQEMRHIMETAIPLRVPVKADAEVGPDWGHVAEIETAA